ncbi:hypothetical protein [Streptomyces flavofungini]|uniref:Uncharacterized protein n=1 Tax=Streptomyces flavofungini TaxID=68200 RepID=A0ABS0X0V5_9ACTN|nr:hypothetical protein [Streptomyces flavofungini]MBJ3806807.1 hypothetical protein [Streptomyces flavofungini]GHC60419.1 hypothetical protein GCM10010349_29720 [Streptomyces flavofungini]
MIQHTMMVSFEGPIPDADLDQFLKDIERVMLDSGHAQTVSARRHLPVPGEEAFSTPAAAAVIWFGLTGTDALAASFTAPGVGELIHHWQSRHPYRVTWANHEPLD